MLYNRILDIEKSVGDCFYIFKADTLKDNISNFLNSFQQIYSNTSIGYSYKTNYLPAACKIADEMGAYAEIVSPMELNIATKLNISGKRILYNGPIKNRESLYYCLKHGSKINIDNNAELDLICEYADQNKLNNIEVGVRLNFELGKGVFSRFGYDPRSDDFKYFLKKLSEYRNIKLTGLHFHSTRSDKSVRSYIARLNKLHEFYQQYENNGDIKYIDLGGGLYGPMDENIKSQFDDEIPSYRDYAKGIATTMKEYFPDENIELILEPGLALTVNILDFYTKVLTTKTVYGTKIINTSGSFYNVKPSGHKKNLTMDVIRQIADNKSRNDKNAKIAGFTCLENDYLYEGYCGTTIDDGNYLCFKNVGAYTIVFKPPFIKLSPAIVQENGDGFEVVKRKEQFEDTFSAYEF